MIQLRRLISIVGLATAAAGIVLAHAQDPVPVPGATYAGTLTGCNATVAPFSLTTAEYGAATITALHITPSVPLISTNDTSISTILWGPPEIRVADDGSFAADSPADSSGIIWHLEGRFVATHVSGSFRISLNGQVCESTFQAELVPPNLQESTFTGQLSSPKNGCGGGSYSITRAADLLSITKISIDGVVADGQMFSGSSTFAEGTVPIDSTGEFGWVYFPGSEPGQEIALIGTFLAEGVNGLDGALTVSPSTCGLIPFGTGICFGPIEINCVAPLNSVPLDCFGCFGSSPSQVLVAENTPITTTPAATATAATATPAAAVSNVGATPELPSLVVSGTGPAPDSGSSNGWLIVGLACAGLAMLASYGALRVRRKIS